MHYHCAEHWIVVRGSAKVARGDKDIVLAKNQSTYILNGIKHRQENPGSIPLEMIEVQSGVIWERMILCGLMMRMVDN